MTDVDTPENNVTRLPDDYDRQMSALYRQLPVEEPPAHINAQIAKLAAAACESEPQPASPPLRKRQVPMPVAALLLVAAGLIPLLTLDLEQKIVTEGLVSPDRKALDSDVPALHEPDGNAALAPQPVEPVASAPVPEPVADSGGVEAERLDAIKVLLARGMAREAWVEFGEFRREFPGYRIPDSLLIDLGEARDELISGKAGGT